MLSIFRSKLLSVEFSMFVFLNSQYLGEAHLAEFSESGCHSASYLDNLIIKYSITDIFTTPFPTIVNIKD